MRIHLAADRRAAVEVWRAKLLEPGAEAHLNDPTLLTADQLEQAQVAVGRWQAELKRLRVQ